MNKQIVVHPYNGILFRCKKKNEVLIYNMDESWKLYTKWRKPNMKGDIVDDSIYLKYPEHINP